MNQRIFALAFGLCAVLALASCGGSSSKSTVSGLPNRVLASEGVTNSRTFGGLVIVNGYNDTLPRLAPIGAGSYPGLMAINPSRSIVAAFDSGSNTVYGIDTSKESDIGQVKLPGPTQSMVVPTSSQVAYVAVPSATVNGYQFTGALEIASFAGGALETIAVPGAQTVVSDSTGTNFLVFSNDSDSVTVVTPAFAVPPVDTSCITNPPNSVCTVVSGFDRPVFAIVSGSTAYVFNCGAECGGTQASIQTLDLSTFTVGTPLPVNGATWGYLNNSTLYVAGLGTPTGPLCSSLTNSINPKTSATYCGTLDIVDVGSMTDPYYNNPGMEIAIPDGLHNRMDLSPDGHLFVGSKGCQDIGDVNNPSGEVRGCLAIYNTNNNTLVIPPDNGEVDGLQSFTSRTIEYVAEGGNLRVYDTATESLYINSQYVPQGTIDVVGYVGGVVAIDFF